ncbi:MAG: tetratricopeptide repeat protein [Thermoanaerobaculia bacterium]|nr:tetratricopeptide repeat protein [Thermoanaerobaculia bacterium]
MANASDPNRSDFEWLSAIGWGALALGISGLVLYGISMGTGWSPSDPLGLRAETSDPDPALYQRVLDQALDEAWVLLGGHGGGVLFTELTRDAERLERAGQLIDGVLASRPRDVRAHVLQGLQHLASGREDEALRSVEHSLELGGGHQSLLVLGTLHTHLGELEQAEAVFRRAVEEYPRSISAWNNLGRVLSQLGRQDEAEAAFLSKEELELGQRASAAAPATSAGTPAVEDGDR